MSFVSYNNTPLIIGDIRLFAESANLSFDADLQVQRTDDGTLHRYAGVGPVRGKVNASFYLTQRNSKDFDLNSILEDNDNGFHDYSTTGFLGEFRFTQAYVNSFSFSAQPYSPIKGSVNFDIFGDLEFDKLSEFDYANLSSEVKAEPIFNGLRTNLEGYDSMISIPTNFSYQYSLSRRPQFVVDKKYPERSVVKQADVTMTIEGDSIKDKLNISGNNASIKTHLHDVYGEYNGFDYRTSGARTIFIRPKGTPGFLSEGDHRKTFNKNSQLMFSPSTGRDPRKPSFVKVKTVSYSFGPYFNEDNNPFPVVAADETVTILTTETDIPGGYRQTGFLVFEGENEISPSIYDFTCSGQIESQSINVSNNSLMNGSITVKQSIR